MAEQARLVMGVDTGGTFTDAVLLDAQRGIVLASAKALTTYGDLAVGIGEAIAGLQPFDASSIELVSLSTTLATNAIVEGRGRPSCLVLIGYDAELLRDQGFMADLGTEDVAFVAGGHDADGNRRAPLDEAALRRVALRHMGHVDAFAVSSYFSVRNPEHELRAKALLEEWTGRPVTCGHDLSSKLNSVKRATTAALNARLIPLLRELVDAVQRTLECLGISAPLMVVKGDGSLVAAEVALAKPVETILSGPAASAVGGRYLCKDDHVVVVDMGGTTTDIAVLAGDQPRLNPEGASVGRWRTMVEAVDVRTVGLGGNSHVTVDQEGQLQIGPLRVVSLAYLGHAHPDVLAILERQMAAKRLPREAGVFLCPNGRMSHDLPPAFVGLHHGPICYQDVLDASGYPYAVRRDLEALEARGLVTRAALTPTDALHVTGAYRLWSEEAARLGIGLLARRLGLDVDAVCQQVIHGVVEKAAREILAKAISDAIGLVQWPGDSVTEYLVGQALDHHESDPLMSYELRMKQPLVAIGAPVAAYFPQVAEHLHAELVIPPHAGVANAVGAVAGSIVQRVMLHIRPLEDGLYRLHGPDGVRDFANLREAATAAQRWGEDVARLRAMEAGARSIELRVDRQDEVVTPADRVEEIYLGSRILVTGVGRVVAGL